MLAEGGILTQQVIHLTSDTKLTVEGSTNNSLTHWHIGDFLVLIQHFSAPLKRGRLAPTLVLLQVS
jgi:hypothetical protein